MQQARHQADTFGSVGSFDEPFGSPPSDAFKGVAVVEEQSKALSHLHVLDSSGRCQLAQTDDLFQFEEEIDKNVRTRVQQSGSDSPKEGGKDAMFKATSSAPDLISQTLVNSLKISHQASSKNISECNLLTFGSQVSRQSLPLAINKGHQVSSTRRNLEEGSPDFLPPHELVAASFKGSPMSRHMDHVGSALNHNSTAGSRHATVADRIKHTLFEQQIGFQP